MAFPFTIPLLFLWLVFGMGHGLFDAVVASRLLKISLARTTSIYLLGFILVAFLAFFLPLPLLVAHLFVSAYHFAATEWGQPEDSSLSYRFVLSFWGLALIAIMVLGPWKEAYPILKELSGRHSTWISFLETYRLFLLAIFGILGLLSAARLSLIHKDPERAPLAAVLEWTLLFLLFLKTPLWLSFTLYLSIWHGLRSLLDDVWPIMRRSLPGRWWILIATLVSTLLITLGVALTQYPALKFSSFAWIVSPTSFSLLVALTFPHSIVMQLAVRARKE